MRHLFLTLLTGFLFFAPNLIEAQSPAKEWVFVNQKNGHERVLKSEQKLTVYWKNKKRPDVSWGRLLDISEDSLVLKIHNRVRSIAKQDIEEITSKSRDKGYRAKQVLLIVAGILVAGLFFLFQAVSDASRLDVQLAAGEKAHIWPWALIGVGMIILGCVHLSSASLRISDPFGDKWIMHEKTTQPSNQP